MAEALTGKDSMNDFKVYRITGWSCLALVVLSLAQFPLYMQGDATVSVYLSC
jgi:hypothetical protein